MSGLIGAIKGDASRIKVMTKIDLSCGHQRAWEGVAGRNIFPGQVWHCSSHGNQVILGVDMSIDGTARDAWAWIADRIGVPQPPMPPPEEQPPTGPITIRVGPGE